MRRQEPVLCVPEGSDFTVKKYSRQPMGDPGVMINLFRQSGYFLTDKRTGKTACYLAQHVTIDESSPVISDIRSRNIPDAAKKLLIRHHRYPNGSFSDVKKLTRVKYGADYDTDRFPAEIALKCYSITGVDTKLEEETIRASHACSQMYTATGEFSVAFESSRENEDGDAIKGSEKYFLMMPYYGRGKDMFSYLHDPGLLKKPITSEQLVESFSKLLHKVALMHVHLGKPIVDVKPENMIPVFDEEGNLIDIHLVDMDGAFYESIASTACYMNSDDYDDFIVKAKPRSKIPLDVDYRSLGVVLSLLCSDLIVDRFMRRSTERRKTPLEDYLLYTFTPMDVELSAAQRELLTMIKQLNSGKRPAVTHTRMQLLHNLDIIISAGMKQADTIQSLLEKLLTTPADTASSLSLECNSQVIKLQQFSTAFQQIRAFRDSIGDEVSEECLAEYAKLKQALFEIDPKLASSIRGKLIELDAARAGESAGAGCVARPATK